MVGNAVRYTGSIVKIVLNLRTAHFRRSRQIHNLDSLFLQEVKLALPVISHNECVDMVLMHIGSLLLPIILRNHKINVTNSFQQLLPLFIGKVCLLMLALPVELIRRQGHDKIIAECFCSPEQIDVAIMQQIEGSISYYTFQDSASLNSVVTSR